MPNVVKAHLNVTPSTKRKNLMINIGKTLVIVNSYVDYEGSDECYFIIDDPATASRLEEINGKGYFDGVHCHISIVELLEKEYDAVELEVEDGYSLDNYDEWSVKETPIPPIDNLITISVRLQ